MGIFETRPLGEVLGDKGYIRGPFGSALVRSELLDEGIPVYEQQHAIHGLRDFRYFISDGKYRELTRFSVQPRDLIISCSGTVGRISMIEEDDPKGIISQALLILRPEMNSILPKFLQYFLNTPIGQQALIQASHGSVQVNIAPRAVVEKIPIPVPSLEEQRAIAAVLGALDDKIELNRRMNATLEGMARALFKSWFVDFDPVRAKMEGRETGLPAEIEALFPGEMEDGRPRGWRVGVFSDLIQPTIGGDWGKDNPFESSVEVICLRGVDLERLRSTGWSNAPSRWIKQSSLIKRQISQCDVLVAASGVGPLGRPLWATPKLERIYGKPVIYSNFCKRFRAGTPAQAIYADRVLQNMRDSDEIWKYASGTSIPNLNQKALLTMHPIVIPPNEVIEHFSQFVRPINEKLFNPESLSLAAVRDALLPKLMSGEIRISNVENLFGVV